LLSWIFVGLIIAVIFGVDFVRRWKRDNAWKRRWSDEQDDD
jgi:hypothetical protein